MIDVEGRCDVAPAPELEELFAAALFEELRVRRAMQLGCAPIIVETIRLGCVEAWAAYYCALEATVPQIDFN